MMTATKSRKKRRTARRKKGGIHRYKFAMCAKKCRGNRSCMSACLRQ
jgi:hypothetical protein